MPNCAISGLHNFCSKVRELCRRARSRPFDTLIGAFCATFHALSDAPINVANGHDLGPPPSSPIAEQNLSNSGIAQFANDKVLLRSYCPTCTSFITHTSFPHVFLDIYFWGPFVTSLSVLCSKRGPKLINNKDTPKETANESGIRPPRLSEIAGA